METIIVGNIGMVYHGENEKVAKLTFDTYKAFSRANYGRAASESVTWMRSGEIHKEYVGRIDRMNK